jgi:hypothetical protein
VRSRDREGGDPDQDGFVEYARRSPNGLVQRGGRIYDSVFFTRTGLWPSADALCEVQGYVIAALDAAASMAGASAWTAIRFA